MLFFKNELIKLNLGKYFKCGYFIVNKTQTPFYVTSSYTNGLSCICFQIHVGDKT